MWQRLYLHIASRHQDVWPKMFKMFIEAFEAFDPSNPGTDPQAQNFQGPFLSQNLCREQGIQNTINVKIKDLCCPRNIQHYLIFLACYSWLVVVQFKICRTESANPLDLTTDPISECLFSPSALLRSRSWNSKSIETIWEQLARKTREPLSTAWPW